MKKLVLVLMVLTISTHLFAGIKEDLRSKLNEIASKMNIMFVALDKYAQNTDENGVPYSESYKDAYRQIFVNALNNFGDYSVKLSSMVADIEPTYTIEISTKSR